MNFFVQFGKRLVSQTPTFFKKIVYFGITLGAIGASIIAAKEQLPLWLVDWADNLIIIGIVSGIVAKTAVVDPHSVK